MKTKLTNLHSVQIPHIKSLASCVSEGLATIFYTVAVLSRLFMGKTGDCGYENRTVFILRGKLGKSILLMGKSFFFTHVTLEIGCYITCLVFSIQGTDFYSEAGVAESLSAPTRTCVDETDVSVMSGCLW